jgi:hypothetical protein
MSIWKLQNEEENRRRAVLVADVTKLERDRCVAIVGGMLLVSPGPVGPLFDAGWQAAVDAILGALRSGLPNGVAQKEET